MRLIKWLGGGANSRAIAGLLSIGAAAGAFLLFLWTSLVVPTFPELGVSPYADGYRAAKRITEPDLRVRSLEEHLRLADSAEKVRDKVVHLSDEELAKLLGVKDGK